MGFLVEPAWDQSGLHVAYELNEFDMQQTVLIYFKTFWSYYKSTAPPCGHLAVQQLKILVAVACLCDRKME